MGGGDDDEDDDDDDDVRLIIYIYSVINFMYSYHQFPKNRMGPLLTPRPSAIIS